MIITDALKVVVEELQVSNPAVAQQIADTINAYNRGLITREESNKHTAELLGTTVEEWRTRIAGGEAKDEQLLAYIRGLRKNYKTALLSNIGAASLHNRFSDQELRDCFDVVVISGELGFVKPEPEVYLHTAEKLGVKPEECVFADDRERHCVGAEDVGMHAVLYHDFVQSKRDIEQLLRNEQK